MRMQMGQMDNTGFSSNNKADDFMVGDTVYVNGEGDWRGKICYLGEVDFAKGEWAGIVLDHPLEGDGQLEKSFAQGNHDGLAKGKRYFQCTPGHGIFVRAKRLSKRLLVPETFDSEKIGLFRERETPPRYFRENSPVSSTHSSGFSKSPSRESSPRLQSPGGTPLRSVSFYGDREREGSPFSTASSTGNGHHQHHQHHHNKPLKIGERVIVASSVGETKTGILRFLGPTEFADGDWAGIELSYPLGKNDGTVRGRQYFQCEHPYGLFVPIHKIESSPANKIMMSKRMGTRDNLFSVMSANRNARAGSYDDYY